MPSCSTPSWRAGRTRRWPTSSSGPACPRRSIERLIRAGAPRLARAAAARAALAAPRGGRARHAGGRRHGQPPRRAGPRGRTADGPAPARRPRRRTCRRSREPERLGRRLRGRRRSTRSARSSRCSAPALDRLGAVTNAALAERRPGPGPDRRPGRDPPAPDDGQGDGLPGPRGRDRAWSTSRSGRTPGRACGASSGATPCCSSTASSSARRAWST